MNYGRLERLLDTLRAARPASSVLQRILSVGVDGTVVRGAGVSRIRNGHHDVLAASDEAATQVESLQVTLAQGPCLEAVRSSMPSFEPDLASEHGLRRWPRFSRAALDHGVAAAFAFPLITGGVAIGALDLYSSMRTNLSDDRVEDAVVLSDLAALAVGTLDEPASIEGEAFTEPTETWAYAAAVHIASGMVAEQLGINVDHALLRLRAVAFTTGRTVTSVADDIVARRFHLKTWQADDH